MQRIARACAGDFDLAHLCAIHLICFRTFTNGRVNCRRDFKGGSQFQFRRFIEAGMADVHRRLIAQDYLTGLGTEAFAQKAGEIIGDVNYVHPFREGNGRTQLLYLEQLAARAGHPLDLRKLDRDAWMEASREAHLGRYEAMGRSIAAALGVERGRVRK